MPGRRQSIDIEGLDHSGNPIPFATKVGNIVHSGGVMGRDPKTREMPTDPARQAELIFQHIRTIMEKAGGTTDDIVNVTVWVRDLQYRQHVNPEWVKMFPEPANRPTRHTILNENLAGGMLIQAQFWASLAE